MNITDLLDIADPDTVDVGAEIPPETHDLIDQMTEVLE
jgi:hypothetical protein